MSARVLFITGRQGKDGLEKAVRELDSDACIHVAGADVAAFLTPEDIAGELESADLDGVEYVIVPGSVQGDLSAVSKKLGVKCVKGPRHLAYLSRAVKFLGGLSPVKPADEIVEVSLTNEVELEYSKAKRKKTKSRIGGLYGGNVPLIVAEVVDAPLLTEEELLERVRHYTNSGADIIDLGMIAGRDNTEKIPSLIESIKSAYDVPVSIDSRNPRELKAAADAGADLILSLDESNLGIAPSIDVPCVVVPVKKDGTLPEKALERVELLEELTKKLVDSGFPEKKIIADPVLSPLTRGFIESVKAYLLFRERNPGTPLLVGVGNVTELVDADSLGVNAVLASMAMELDAELVFTTEASSKTRGAVSELSTALKMMYYASQRNQPPKDLGIDLLRMKEKRHLDAHLTDDERKVELVRVGGSPETESVGNNSFFRVYVVDDEIRVYHYTGNKPVLGFCGVNALALVNEINSRLGLDAGHAAYLARELTKAELAIKLGRIYIQDQPPFK